MTMMIDLSRKMEAGMPVYPGDPLFQSSVTADHDTDGYHVARLTFGSHTGTHLDAPFHSFEDGETLDSFPPERFFPSATVLDLTSRLAVSEGGRFPAVITPDLLAEFAPAFDAVDCVILKTGWSNRWGTPDFYETFPSLLPETAEWIAEQPIQMLGMETPSLSSLAHFALGDSLDATVDSERDWPSDNAKNCRLSPDGVANGPFSLDGKPKGRFPLDEAALLHSDAEGHRILLGRTPPILLLEGLTNLDRLPTVTPDAIQAALFANTVGPDSSVGAFPHFTVSFNETFADRIFDLACFPLLTDRADGSPVRAVAILRK